MEPADEVPESSDEETVDPKKVAIAAAIARAKAKKAQQEAENEQPSEETHESSDEEAVDPKKAAVAAPLQGLRLEKQNKRICRITLRRKSSVIFIASCPMRIIERARQL